MTTQQTSRASDRVLQLVSAALNLEQAGETDEALQILERVQREAPQVAQVHLLSGLLLRDAGRPEEAEASLRRAVELDPDLSGAVQSLGLLLFGQGRTEEAVEWLTRHLELEPADPLTLKALSTGLPRLGKDEEAVQILDEAWRLTHNPEAGIIYGRHLIRVGHLDEAETVLKQVSEEAPLPRALVEWAYALALLRRYPEAQRVLLRIIDIDPTFGRAWRGLTDCYIPMGRYEDALRAAEQALALDDTHCRNWWAKTNTLLSLERYAEAYESAVNGIECVPRDDLEAQPVLHELYLQSIESLFQVGRFEDALAQLDAARRGFPTSETFLRIQASALNQMERVEEAQRVLEEAREGGISLTGGLAPLYYETLHLTGHPEDARAFVEPLLQDDHWHRIHVLADVGLRLYQRSKVDAARSVFEQLHAWVPEAPHFASNLGFILVGEGALTEAETLFTQALDSPNSAESRPLILANLGYLRLIQHDYASAAECLEEAAVEAEEESRAILRIAQWQGAVVPDPVPHPTRLLAVKAAARANQVMLALAQGKIGEAESQARALAEEGMEAAWGQAVLAQVLLARGDAEGAGTAREAALADAETPSEREAIERWLSA